MAASYDVILGENICYFSRCFNFSAQGAAEPNMPTRLN
jgi:hypothetical protein